MHVPQGLGYRPFGLRANAFTLLEMLVSMTVMVFMLVVFASLIGMVSSTYQRSMGTMDSFGAARTAFDSVARTLRQATLQSYMGYDQPRNPQSYRLKSDLHFVAGPQAALSLADTVADESHAVFFQAPLGTSTELTKARALMTSTGFFILRGMDPLRPGVLGTRVADRRRYRLFQFIEPREQMSVYTETIDATGTVPVANESYQGHEWFEKAVNEGQSIHPLADNVVALVIWPMLDGQRQDNWNSRNPASANTHHRMPEALEVTLVTIDEASAIRLDKIQTPGLLTGLFASAATYTTDLATLEDRLSNLKLNYRLFQTTLPLTDTNPHL